MVGEWAEGVMSEEMLAGNVGRDEEAEGGGGGGGGVGLEGKKGF